MSLNECLSHTLFHVHRKKTGNEVKKVVFAYYARNLNSGMSLDFIRNRHYKNIFNIMALILNLMGYRIVK